MAADAGRMELSESEGYWLDIVITTTERDISAEGFYVSVTAEVDDELPPGITRQTD